MLGNRMRCEGKKGLLVWAFLFLVGGIGAQAAPVVSSFKINNGAVSTMNPAVTLPNACEGATGATHSYMASESPDFTGAAWKPYASVPLFILSNTTSGTKTVYFKVKDSANAESSVTSDTITLGGEGYSVVAWGTRVYGLCDTPTSNSGFVAIAAGYYHNLAIKSDGSLVAWGSNKDDNGNYTGQCDVPLSNKDFVAISAGHFHSLGLKSDGSIKAWGSNIGLSGNRAGQSDEPSPNSDFVAVAAGGRHSLGLKSDGSIVAWGEKGTVPEPNSGFVAISAGLYHSVGLKSDGSVAVWGNSSYTIPSPNTGFVSIVSGNFHALGLKANGSVVVLVGAQDLPSPNSDIIALAAGHSFSLGLRSDSTIVAWGANYQDQCFVPLPNSGFADIAAAGAHSLALTPEGFGNLQVALAPSRAIAVGAQWRLTSETAEAWHNSDYIAKVRGDQDLVFKDVYGWVKPVNQLAHISAGTTVSLTGDYRRTSWTLTTACEHGKVTISPDVPQFLHETKVTVTIQPDPGYWFDHWTGDVPVGREQAFSFVVTMDANKTLEAHLGTGALPPPPIVSTFKINSGVALTANPAVTLANTCEATSCAVVQYQASESPDFAGAVWKPYVSVSLFTLSSATTGTKTVYFKVKNTAGIESAVTSDTISLRGYGCTVVSWGQPFSLFDMKGLNSDFVALSIKGEHCLGLKTNGSVVAWGMYGGGAYILPSPNRDFVAISAGISYGLGLKSDGSIVAWGDNSYGQCDVPDPNRDFVAIAAGENTSFGLKSDGSIVAWGNGNKVPLPSPNRDFVAIAAGRFHCLGLKSDGSVVAWGPSNFSGQLTVPTPNYGFTAVAAGDSFSVGLKSDGAILSWGEVSCKFYPPNKNFVAITAGMKHCLGLKADGSIEGAGSGSWGQCRVPTPNSDYVAVAAGGNHSLSLAPQGALEVTLAPPEAIAAGARWRLKDEKAGVWHNDTVYDPVAETSSTLLKSRIGLHTLTFDNLKGWTKPADRQVELTTTGTVQAAGEYKRIYCTLTTDCDHGAVLVSPAGASFPMGSTVTLTVFPDTGYWFNRWTGDVPRGLEQINPLVLTMDTTKTVGVSLASGPPPAAPVVTDFSINHGLATTANPNVTLPNTCTAETSGSAVQYLASESSDFTGAAWRPYVSIPLFRLSSGKGTKTVYFKVKNCADMESAVTSDTITLLGDGNVVKAWGDSTDIPSPNEDFVALAAGRQHTLALKSDGSIVAWGNNAHNQCTVPSPNRDFVAISAGEGHSLGLKSDGSVVAWGLGSLYQCNIPSPNRDFVAVAAGYYFSMGLKSDGSIVAWGDHRYQQCLVPTPNSGFVDIAAGEGQALGLKFDGSIVAWGNNFNGQCAVPAPNTGFVSIAGGELHSLGLKSDGSIVAWGGDDLGQCTVPEPNANFVSVEAGAYHSLGLKSDGSIVAWGKNDEGQCDVPTPNRAFAAIAGGVSRSLALVSGRGSLEVTLTPSEAVAAGARWRIAGENVWHESGSLMGCRVGTHTLELLDDLPGWYAQPTTQTITIQADELTTATGTYVSGQTWPLSVTAQHGAVVKSPSKTNYRAGETVTLTAMPAARYHFASWSGDAQGSANPLTLTMDSTKTLTANFEINRYPLTALVAPQEGGTITSNPQGTVYDAGTVVTLTATPAEGYRFVNWTGDVAGANPSVQVAMDGNKTVCANFEPIPPCTVTLTADPALGGIVSKSPDLPSYVAGTLVTLSAVAAEGYKFGGWYDGDVRVSTETQYVYWVETENKTFTAKFFLWHPFVVVLVADPAQGGTLAMTPSLPSYELGDQVTLTAIPAEGYEFRGWWDGDTTVSTEVTYVYTVTEDKIFVAKFKPVPDSPWTITVIADPPEGGTVSKSPDLASQGTTVTLTAAPNAGYSFVGWYADAALATTSTSYVITVGPETFKTTFTAKFRPDNQYSLTLVANLPDAASLTKTPDREYYEPGTTITLTAVPVSGYRVYSWMDGSVTLTTYTWSFEYVMPAKDTTLTALLEMYCGCPGSVKAVADPAEGGTVTRTPNQEWYWDLSTVQLDAAAAEGFVFCGWYEGATTVSTRTSFRYTVRSHDDKIFTARFKPEGVPSYPVTIVADPVKGGTVSKSPNQSYHVEGSTVTLSAAPRDGWRFLGWWDGTTTVSTSTSFVYTVSGEKTFTARFKDMSELFRTVTVIADPLAGGSVSKSPNLSSYEVGTQVTLRATPQVGWRFCGWLEGETTVSTNASFVYTVSANKTFTAKFKEILGIWSVITIVADPVNGGAVWKTPDQPNYQDGTPVTLNAAAAEGYLFGGWYDGNTLVSTETPYEYWVGTENKTLVAKFLEKPTFVLTVTTNPVDGGAVSKAPDQIAYLEGATVTLTATPWSGHTFNGWYDGTTLLSTSVPFVYTMPALSKVLTARFASKDPQTPTDVAAVGNTYMVLVSWTPVTSVTAYVVTRTAGDDVTSWTVGAVSEFADDTAVPGVTYSYTVAALDAQGAAGTPSEAVSASVTAETFTAAAYKVTAKGYAMTRDLPTTGGLTFTQTGAKAGTIKIAALKRLPKNTADNPAKGIYYLLNQGQVSTLAIAGDVKTLAFDVPVYSLETTGAVKAVSAKSVMFLSAREFGKVTIAATKASEQGLYARTFIETLGASTTPMLIKASGAVIEEVAAAQPIKLINVATKAYKDAAKVKRTSLGAVGSLPKVVAEISNTPAPQSEATPCSIQGQAIKAVTVSDGPIVADEIRGAIDKVTVTGGNLRCGLIQSSKNIVLLQATAKKVSGATVGGAVGTAGQSTAMVVAAQPAANSKRVAITKVYGQAGVAGYFYAGYDAQTGAPTHTGGIGVLQTKTGQVEGAAFLDPALVAKMKVLPEGQPIAINPE